MVFTPMQGNFCTGLENGNIPWPSSDYSNSAISAVSPHTGTYCLDVPSGGWSGWFRVRPGLISDVYIGVWLKPSVDIFRITTACYVQAILSDNQLVELRFENATWKAYVAGILVRAGTVVITPNIYHHLQVHFVIADAGAIETKIDGISDVTYAGDTKPLASLQIEFIRFYVNDTVGAGSVLKVDDLVIGTGGWPGDLRADGIKPESDTATVQWTLSAGVDTFELINEVPASDVDYIYTDADAQQSIVELEDWAGAGKTPVFVVQRWRAKKSEAGAEQIKLIDSDGVNTNVDGGHDVQTDYTYIDKIMATAPDGSAWVDATVDGLQIGVESNI